jgi:histidyl-tRNA synthetase
MFFERPRGVRDFGPKEMDGRVHVESVLLEAFRSFGYRRVQTPTFESLELFCAKSGSGISEHLYVFDDKGGRRLCLRPEATAQVARMFSSDLRNLPKPLRLSYVSPMFRYEEPQKGRYREFWQAGVELIGASGPEADAECICLAGECIRRLGLSAKIRINHIGVLRELLNMRGLDEAEQNKVINLLDKGDYTAVRQSIGDGALSRLLDIRGSSDSVDVALSIVPEGGAKSMLQVMKKTLSLLDAAGVAYEVDFSMARGLDYYTGIVFDAKVDGLGAQNQVLGGGRYDNLIALFGGPSTPAVGFAFGLDRLIDSMEAQSVPLSGYRPDAYVIPVSEEVRGAAFVIAAKLRRAAPAKVIESDIAPRKLNKALQHAVETGAKYAIIVGAAELTDESVMLKDLTSQKQDTVRISDLLNHLN